MTPAQAANFILPSPYCERVVPDDTILLTAIQKLYIVASGVLTMEFKTMNASGIMTFNQSRVVAAGEEVVVSPQRILSTTTATVDAHYARTNTKE